MVDVEDVRRTRVEATKRCLAVRSRSGPGRDHARDTLVDTTGGQLRHERSIESDRRTGGGEGVPGRSSRPHTGVAGATAHLFSASSEGEPARGSA